MNLRTQAALATVMTLALSFYVMFYFAVLPLASATPDPSTGRTWLWPDMGRRHTPHYVTHDQFIALAVLAGLFAVSFALSLIFEDRRRRTL